MGDEKFEAARTCIRKASAAARLHADKLSIGKLGRHNVCSRTNQNVRLAEPDVIAVTSVDHNLAFQIDEIDRADHAFATTPYSPVPFSRCFSLRVRRVLYREYCCYSS